MFFSVDRRTATQSNKKMTPQLTPIKRNDGPTWKVSVDGKRIGFVYKTRFSWGYCNSRSGRFPKSWVCTEVKSQDEAVAKLISVDAELFTFASGIISR